jgi:predicted enzyme related to lactoylglutathione lyase
MPDVHRYEPGSFSWAELATTDSAAAKAFYAALFGWTFEDHPMGPGPDDVYTRIQMEGKDVGALHKMRPEQHAQGVPPNWLSYVTVDRADESAKKARDQGGEVLTGPFDVMTLGRMAMIRDPGGAMFAIWQPGEHIGAERINEPGALGWQELWTRDTGKAGKFYTGLFGWRIAPASFDPNYTEFWRGGRPAGGMTAMPAEMADVPAHWAVYWRVEDCDAAVARALRLGGRALTGPQDIPTVGRFAALADPQGATFSIIQLAAR